MYGHSVPAQPPGSPGSPQTFTAWNLGTHLGKRAGLRGPRLMLSARIYPGRCPSAPSTEDRVAGSSREEGMGGSLRQEAPPARTEARTKP